MTDTQDLTSPEAVERLREIADYAETDTSKAIWDYAEAIRGAADQIEALSAALEYEKRHKLAIAGVKIDAVSELRQVKAESDALKAELAEAVELLVSAETVMQFVLDHEASELDRRLTIKDAMSSQKEICAFLARHQKGTKP